MKEGFKLILLIIGILVTVSSCTETPVKTEVLIETEDDPWEGIKNVDDLIEISKFIEAYPNSKKFDSAINRYVEIQKMLMDSVSPAGWNCGRSCISIFINENDSILFDNQLTSLDSVFNLSYRFFTNTGLGELTTETREYKEIQGTIHSYSSGNFIVSFIPDSASSLQNVIIQIRTAIEKYRNDLVYKWYEKPFSELNEIEKNQMDSLFARRIVLWDVTTLPGPPAPPIVFHGNNEP